MKVYIHSTFVPASYVSAMKIDRLEDEKNA